MNDDFGKNEKRADGSENIDELFPAAKPEELSDINSLSGTDELYEQYGDYEINYDGEIHSGLFSGGLFDEGGPVAADAYPDTDQYLPYESPYDGVLQPEEEAFTPSPAPGGGKGILKKYVTLLCIICALIGGIAGGVSGGLISRIRLVASEDAQETSTGAPVIGSPLPDEVGDERDNETLAGQGETDAPPDAETTSQTEPAIARLTAKEIYANSVNSVVGISADVTTSVLGQQTTSRVSGTGFLISENGYIVTNYHVVSGGSNLVVSLYNGEEYPATLVGSEKSNDIAVLKIDEENLSPVQWGNSDDLSVGDELLIIGNPLGELTYTLTNGVVSALSRQIESESDVINMFQTNAAINSGNSGGPVFDMNGEVVGIATSKYVSSSIEGLSFFIPVNDVIDYIMDIIQYGYVKNLPFIGVSAQTVTNSMASRYNIVRGAYIVALGQGTPAEAAGIMQGDVIVSLNGVSIDTVAALQKELNSCSSGDGASIEVFRNGSRETLQITFGEKLPADPRTSYSSVYDL